MAVSTELRQRAVDAYERGEGSIRAIAAQYGVGSASLARWLRQQRTTGTVERRPQTGGKPRKITPEGERLLLQWLEDDPTVSQTVLAARLAEVGQPVVSQQTVGRTLTRMGWSRPDPRQDPSGTRR